MVNFLSKEPLLHQESYDIDMLGLSVFLHASSTDFIQLTPQAGTMARLSDVMGRFLALFQEVCV